MSMLRRSPGSAARSSATKRGAPATLPAPPFVGRTQYVRRFLLIGHALSWLDLAQDCISDEFGLLQRGLLS